MEEDLIYIPCDLFPQLIARCDFCTFVKYVSLDRYFSMETNGNVSLMNLRVKYELFI
jgi:hypothetical protein